MYQTTQSHMNSLSNINKYDTFSISITHNIPHIEGECIDYIQPGQIFSIHIDYCYGRQIQVNVEIGNCQDDSNMLEILTVSVSQSTFVPGFLNTRPDYKAALINELYMSLNSTKLCDGYKGATNILAICEAIEEQTK